MHARIYDLNAESVKRRCGPVTDDKFTFLGPRNKNQTPEEREQKKDRRKAAKEQAARLATLHAATDQAKAKQLRDNAAKLQSLAAETEKNAGQNKQTNKRKGKAPRDLKPPNLYRDSTTGREYLRKLIFDRPQLRAPAKNLQFEQSELHFRTAMFTQVRIKLGLEGESQITPLHSRLFAANNLGILVMSKCIGILRNYNITQNRLDVFNSVFKFTENVASVKESSRPRIKNHGMIEKGQNNLGYDKARGIENVIDLIKSDIFKQCKDQLKNASQGSAASNLSIEDLRFETEHVKTLWKQQTDDLLTEMIFDAKSSRDISTRLYKFACMDKLNPQSNLNVFWKENDIGNVLSTIQALLEKNATGAESIQRAKESTIYNMAKELILGESVRLHNKALSHITALCQNINHPEAGHKLCIIYKNSIMKLINANAEFFNGDEIAILMNAVGAINDVVEKDKKTKAEEKALLENTTLAAGTTIERNNHLLSALATSQNGDKTTTVGKEFTVTLFRALGFKYTGDMKKLQPYLLNQIHTALMLEAAHILENDIPTQSLIVIERDNSKHDLGTASASLQKAARNISNVVNIRKRFYMSFNPTTVQTGRLGSKDIIALMHSNEVKENAKQLVKYLPEIKVKNELFCLSNALGITSTPLLSNVLKWGPLSTPADALKVLTLQALALKEKIAALKITANKLLHNIQDEDYTKAGQLLVLYKEQEENSKHINSFLVWSFAQSSQAANQNRYLNHGWLRSRVMGGTRGVANTTLPTHDDTVPITDDGVIFNPIDYSAVSKRLYTSNVKNDGSQEDVHFPISNVVSSIFRARFEAEYGWIFKKYAKALMPSTMSKLGNRDENPRSHFNPSQKPPAYFVPPQAGLVQRAPVPAADGEAMDKDAEEESDEVQSEEGTDAGEEGTDAGEAGAMDSGGSE